ncbi:MAG: LptF/LptG family permease [Flavobacteriales bacterium]|nr:LptF/LptG family permease [Flavobacteriales bacterium]
MKQIDLYIIRKFLLTFFYAIGLIILVVIIFDISEKLDDFIESDAPISAIVFDYYLNFVPFFVNLFSSLFTFIAVIFFTSKMAANTEIVAILSSGMSFNRLLVPYMAGALVITSMSLYLNNFVIPHTNKARLEFEETFIRHKFRNIDRNIHRQIEPNTFVYFDRYDNITGRGYKFAIERFEENELKYKLMSDTISWDSTMKKWHISNYMIRTMNGPEEELVSGNGIDTTINFHPNELGKRINNVQTMNYYELTDYIKKEKLKGSEKTMFYEIEHHKRFSVPFATFILTLIGVSLASRKVRGGIGVHITFGLVVSFAYILFMQVSLTFATNANLSPMLAMWIPNILFGILALYLYKIAPK